MICDTFSVYPVLLLSAMHRALCTHKHTPPPRITPRAYVTGSLSSGGCGPPLTCSRIYYIKCGRTEFIPANAFIIKCSTTENGRHVSCVHGKHTRNLYLTTLVWADYSIRTNAKCRLMNTLPRHIATMCVY